MNIATFANPLGLMLAAGMTSGIAALGMAPSSLAEEPVGYEIVDDESIPQSLTGASGDADKGREVFINRKQGNCLGCHAVTELGDQPFHGEVGPPLDGVADIYAEGEIRLRIVNAKIVNPDTIMPGFYVNQGLHRVAATFQGKTILSAEQVEDLVAYMLTLKES
ncbi:MAG: sulfur oxidation c-type cytochrome SoxX [Geminicoccaceae bacterium]